MIDQQTGLTGASQGPHRGLTGASQGPPSPGLKDCFTGFYNPFGYVDTEPLNAGRVSNLAVLAPI